MSMNSNRSKNGANRAADVTALLPDGTRHWRSGVDEGLRWADTADPDKVNPYLELAETDVKVQLGLDGEQGAVTLFNGRFEPPNEYRGATPEASGFASELEAWKYWTGWLAGVNEAAARKYLARLRAPTNQPRTLVMDSPRPGECPICWIERNLGVRVVIHGASHDEEVA
jgi:hypothetical protein